MIQMRNFINENSNIKVVDSRGIFTIIEHEVDMSVVPATAQVSYYMSAMNCCKRQVVVNLKNNAIRLKPGAMQMILGNVQSSTGVTGVGDLANKFLKSKVTGDAPIKPLYKGTGTVITEPTYNYLLIEDVAQWGGMVCDDGMFVCCDDEVKDDIQARANFSSAIAGGEGLFNLLLRGNGLAVVKSPNPREELYEILLDNDIVKIDGSNAICWSSSLDFTVERSSRSLLGSAVNGEGLVNVYRGTGKILVAPVF